MSILKLDERSLEREPTVWDLSMWLLGEYCKLKKAIIVALGTDVKKRIEALEEEAQDIAKAFEYASRIEAEAARKARDDELDYFCGRHTFYPSEL